MPVFCHSVWVACPVDVAFDVVADVKTHPRWQSGLVEAGAGFEVRRVLGRAVRFDYEITDFERPNQWGFRALNGPVRPSAVLSFRTEGAGTRISSKMTIPGFQGWLVGGMMLRQQKRNYKQLKKLLESGALSKESRG